MMTKAARATAGSDYGDGRYSPFFEKPGDGGGAATIDPEANANPGPPTALAGDPETASPVRPSDAYNAAVAQFSQIADTVTDAALRAEAAAEAAKKLQEESRKLRPMPRSAQGSDRSILAGWRTWDEVLYEGAPDNGDEHVARTLNDRVMLRALLRGYTRPELKRDSKGDEYTVFRHQVPNEAWDEIPEMGKLRRVKAHVTLANDIYDTQNAGEGSEWVPTLFSSELWDFYRIRGDFLAALPTMNIPRGTGSYTIPTLTAEDQARIVSEQQTATANFVNSTETYTNTTASATLAPKKHWINKQFSTEAEEDWAIETLSYGRRAVQQILVAAIEQAVINGQDTDDADLDDDAATSNLYSANGWGGGATGVNSLRLHTIINSDTTSIGGDVTAADILAARKSMGKYGAKPGELLYITSPAGYLGMLSDTNVLTVEKYGSGATVLTGELARAGGVRILMSDQFPEDLAATGIDAGTGSTTGGVLFNLTQWVFGIKRAINITMLPGVGMDVMNVIGSVRSHFVIRESASNAAWYLINVT